MVNSCKTLAALLAGIWFLSSVCSDVSLKLLSCKKLLWALGTFVREMIEVFPLPETNKHITQFSLAAYL